MERIRDMLRGMGVRLNDMQWQNLQLRMIEVRPPGADEICAALRELETPCGPKHNIVLWSDGAGAVRAIEDVLGPAWKPGDDIPAAIRSLTRAPEPTLEENLHTVELSLCEDVTDWADRRAAAREALKRARKQVEKISGPT